MKARDSGMPPQDYWESLFDVPAILDGLGFDAGITDAVELGCGYGTFTLPVAQRLCGKLHAYDIEPEMIAACRHRLTAAAISNTTLHERDVISHGFGCPAASVDAVLLFNILHLENPATLLHASADILRPGGRIMVIHWRSDIATPRGPDSAIRPKPEQVLAWAKSTGRLEVHQAPSLLLPWHYGVVLTLSGAA